MRILVRSRCCFPQTPYLGMIGSSTRLEIHDACEAFPREYHALKCVAHSLLGLFGHLGHEPGKPLGKERIKTLKEYRDLLAAAGPAATKCGFDPDTLARQKRIVARGLLFIDAVLKDG